MFGNIFKAAGGGVAALAGGLLGIPLGGGVGGAAAMKANQFLKSLTNGFIQDGPLGVANAASNELMKGLIGQQNFARTLVFN